MKIEMPVGDEAVLGDKDREILKRVMEVINGQQKPLLLGREGANIEIPEPVFHILTQAVRLLASGKSVTILSQEEEFTTQAAANFLGISRPYLIKMLDEGKLPFHFVGTHRRIKLQDLQKFDEERGRNRRDALNRIAEKVKAAGLDSSAYTGEG